MYHSYLTEKQKAKIKKKLLMKQLLDWITIDRNHRPTLSEVIEKAKKVITPGFNGLSGMEYYVLKERRDK